MKLPKALWVQIKESGEPNFDKDKAMIFLITVEGYIVASLSIAHPFLLSFYKTFSNHFSTSYGQRSNPKSASHVNASIIPNLPPQVVCDDMYIFLYVPLDERLLSIATNLHGESSNSHIINLGDVASSLV